jgi:pyrimidine deaminase RibD-like protein
MRWAVEQADRVKGATYPNPPVGAVILDRDGEVAGVGATEPPGGPHAEVVALRRAGERAVVGTAVVTLEPCNHYGRTPPCVDALVASRVSRVAYAVADPNPEAAGGASRLAESGTKPVCDRRRRGWSAPGMAAQGAPGCPMSHGNSPPASTAARRTPRQVWITSACAGRRASPSRSRTRSSSAPERCSSIPAHPQTPPVHRCASSLVNAKYPQQFSMTTRARW